MTHDSILAVIYEPACQPTDVVAWARKRESIIEALPATFRDETHDVVLYTQEVVDGRMLHPGPDEVVLFGSRPIIFRHTDNPEWVLALRMGEAALYLVNGLPMIGVVQQISSLPKATDADTTWDKTKIRAAGRITSAHNAETWERIGRNPAAH